MKKILLITLFLSTLSVYSVNQTNLASAEAMFLYNFSRLIQWPTEYRSGNFIIGVVGNTPVHKELVTYTNGKKVGFQEIEIKKFKTTEDIGKCHLIFIPISKNSKTTEITQRVSSFSTLVVSEKAGTIEAGAAICFLVDGTKLQFELKEENATKYGLKISARLRDMAAKLY